jgi:hypothetical protein
MRFRRRAAMDAGMDNASDDRSEAAGLQARSAQLCSPHTRWQTGTPSALASAGKTRLSAGLPDSRHLIVPAKTPAAVASS